MIESLHPQGTLFKGRIGSRALLRVSLLVTAHKMADEAASGGSAGTMAGEATALPVTSAAPVAATSAGVAAKRTSKTGGKAVVARKSSKAAEKDVRRRGKTLERLCAKGQRG